MSESVVPPELFVREYLTHAENRVNLALFSLMLIPSIHQWLMGVLKLPLDSVVYPPRNTRGYRPDFVVCTADRSSVRAWIEVELGGEDHRQLRTYRDHYKGSPVRSIVGKEDALGGRADLSLQQVADHVARRLLLGLDPQQKVTAHIFIELVRLLARSKSRLVPIDPDEAMRQRPLILELTEQLHGLLVFGSGKVRPGRVQVMTQTQRGWTVRVYASGSGIGSVSLLWDPAIGAGEVRVPSIARLSRCLPTASEAITAFETFFSDLGLNLGSVPEGRSLPIAESLLLEHVLPLADCIQRLATTYGRLDAVPLSNPRSDVTPMLR